MDINEVLDLIEGGMQFTEVYRFVCNAYPNIDSTWLWNMLDVAFNEYKEELHK